MRECRALLVDAGDNGETEYADPKPDGTRTPGEWIARYVQHMLAGRAATLDYAELVPFDTLVDRGYGYQPPPASDKMFANSQAFVAAQTKARSVRVVHAVAGSPMTSRTRTCAASRSA